MAPSQIPSQRVVRDLLQTLRVGTTGSAVSQIHACLLHLRYSQSQQSDANSELLPAEELANSVFGTQTRQVLIKIQTKLQQDLPSGPTGIWDRETAAAVFNQLAKMGISLDCPPFFFVAGRIAFLGGSPASKNRVLVFDRDLGSDVQVAATTTDPDGYFFASFARPAISRPNERPPSLAIRVMDTRGKTNLFDTPLENLAFNATSLTIFHTNLSQRALDAPGGDEFSQIVSAMDDVLPPLKQEPSNPGPKLEILAVKRDLGKRIAKLRDDNKTSDLQYLKFLPSFTVDPGAVSKLVLSYRLADLALSELKIAAPAELFYALLATDAHQSFAAHSDANIGLADLDLATPIKPLLFQLALQSDSALQAKLDQAIVKGIVSQAAMDRINPGKIFETIRIPARDWLIREPTLEDSTWTRIWEFLTSGNATAFVDLLRVDDVHGDLLGFVLRLAAALQPNGPQGPQSSAVETAASGKGRAGPADEGTAEEPRTNLVHTITSKHFTSRRAVAATTQLALRKHIAAELGKEIGDEEVSLSADLVAKNLEKQFPTSAFTSRLREFVNTSTAGFRAKSLTPERQTPAPEAPAPTVLGRGKATLDASALLAFTDKHPDFDLAKDSLHLVNKDDLDETLFSDLRIAQRVFRLAPTFSQCKSLLDMEVQSAGDVSRLGRVAFIQATQANGEMTVAEATKAFEKATNIYTAAGLLAGQLHGLSNALLPAGLSPPLPPEKVERLGKEFPNLKSLFSTRGMCASADCKTILSPAAYLVDIFQFLAARNVVDSNNPNITSRALQVLLGRRPDLGDLNLDCANANTTLPYVDLVCELLEDLVAPDGATPATYTAVQLEDGHVPADLLVLLRDKLGLPFTERAMVHGPDARGAFTVRGETSLVALRREAVNPRSWKVSLLRQTFLDSASLAAMPAYVNPTAYERLSASEYLPALPFNLNLVEARSYLKQLGLPRTSIMEAFQTSVPSDYAIALETLSLSNRDGDLITRPRPTEQERFWNTGTTNSISALTVVQSFVDAARITYGGLQSMLAGTFWLNPPETEPQPSPPVGVVGRMFIKHLNSSCSLDDKRIINLDLPALDRFHRFLRLLNALRAQNQAWTALALDRAITVTRVGGGDVSQTLVTNLARVTEISKTVSSKIPTTVHDVLDLFDNLAITSHSEPSQPLSATYQSVYLDELRNGKVDPAFQLSELSKTPTELLDGHASYISRSLSLPVDDVSTMISRLENDLLSYGNLSRLYATSSLAKRLELSIADFYKLQDLSTINPLNSLSGLTEFIKTVQFCQTHGFSASDLVYILRHPSQPAGATSPNDLGEGTIKSILASIHVKSAESSQKFTSTFDDDLSAAENRPGVLEQLAQVPAIDREALARFDKLLNGDLLLAEAQELIRRSLGELLGDTSGLENAYSQVLSDPDSEAAKSNLAKVFASSLSSRFALVQRRTDLIQILVEALGSEKPVVTVLVDRVSSLVPLLGTTSGGTPEEDPNYASRYTAVRKAGRLVWVLERLNVKPALLGWLLDHAAALGWPRLDDLPFDGVGEIPLADWVIFVEAVTAIAKPEFPPVRNQADPSKPFTLAGLFELSILDSMTLPDLQSYLASLAGFPTQHLEPLCTHFGFAKSSFQFWNTAKKLRETARLIRRANMPPADVFDIASRADLDVPLVLKIRNALKGKYPASEWLGALRTIQDRLRIQKRDALVAFILAYNKGTISSATELSERLLLDVEMSSEALTSRIIQAHQSVQLFAQRLLMGSEPTRILAGDAGWDRWTEMSQYRVWEANKKVFIWPELYLEPELRDDKSELFTAVENSLQQGKLDNDAVEKAAAAYLASLDQIASMEVLGSFYDTSRGLQHVFAKTRLGDPAELHYRTLEFDTIWSPWEKVEGVTISGSRLCAFYRNERLTIAWPVFTVEQEPQQMNTPPRVPTEAEVSRNDSSAEPALQRVKVQLAVSERNPSTMKWSEKLVSEGGVYWPRSGYKPANEFPDDLQETFAVWYCHIGDKPGDNIVLSELDKDSKRDNTWRTFAVFNLFGCRACPEPYVAERYYLRASDRMQYSGMYQLPYQMFPRVENTEVLSDVFRKHRDAGNNRPSVLSIAEILDASSTANLFGKTRGRFSVANSMNFSEIDKLIFAVQVYGLVRRQAVAVNYEESPMIAVSFGTFMPYFYSDSSFRGYFLRPGFRSVVDTDKNIRTTADTFDFFHRALTLARTYIGLFLEGKFPTLSRLRTAVESDPEYIALRTEFLHVYFDSRLAAMRPRVVDALSFFHPLICTVRSALYRDGMKGMLSRKTQLSVGEFSFSDAYRPNGNVQPPLPRDELDFSVGGSYSGYNWELFFHLPFEIADKFAQDQQFEEARKWYHYIFNPQGDDMVDPDGVATAPQKKYWITKPFFTTSVAGYTEQLLEEMLEGVSRHPDGASLEDRLKLWVQNWRAHPFSPHAVARTRPVAFQIAIVLKYIKLHLDWGDHLFRQLTRESITQASQLYMTASTLLGPRPQKVPKAVETPPRTYNELGARVDILGNAMLDLENLIPDLGDLPHKGKELADAPLSMLYFDVPPNEAILEHWDTVEDRLFKIRHSQDVNGNFVSLALTAPPIDPAALVRALASGASLGGILQGFSSPLPHYRFRVMIERATALTGDVIRLGNSLLSMLQARDAEGLGRLRSELEIQVLDQVRGVKVVGIEEAKKTIDTIEAAKATANARVTHYERMVQLYVDVFELTALALVAGTDYMDVNISSLHGAAGIASLAPTVSVGIAGFGGSPNVSASWGGSNLAAAAGSAAAILQTHKAGQLSQASRLQTKSGFHRRSLEYQFQKNLAELDQKHLEAQKLAAEEHQKLLEKDLLAHEKTIDSATQTGEYLRTKYTNQELYAWNVQRVSAIFFQTYQMAFGLAKKAERCFSHELADYGPGSSIVSYGHWDDLRSGLTSGEHLMFDIKRLETAYLDRNKREFELSKNISLSQLDPIALLSLRYEGRCTFSIPEALFDLDCPGHYLRRIKTVSLSLPCVAGPLTSITAKLTLTSNRYRAKISLPSTSGTTPLARYRETPPGGDPRFVYNVGTSTTCIVTSTASSDPGVLSLSLADERYLPFEGVGAVGAWLLELPRIQQFDYASISDAIISISYTSRDGGAALRGAVEAAQLDLLSEMETDESNNTAHRGLRVGYRLRTQMAGEWWALKREGTARVVFADVHLPFFATAGKRVATVGKATWFVRGGFTEEQVQEGVVLLVGGQEVRLVEGGMGFLVGESDEGAIRLGEEVVLGFREREVVGVVEEVVVVHRFDVKDETA